MPVYPCRKCGTPVDPTADFACRNCKEKQPYDCSRCNKVIGPDDIFQLDRLKTKKPLLCVECGQSGEVVKCGVCKLSLVRSSGLVGASSGKIYHHDCHTKQLKTVGTLTKMIPLMGLFGLVLGGIMGRDWGIAAMLVSSLVMAVVCVFIDMILIRWQTPD